MNKVVLITDYLFSKLIDIEFRYRD